MKFYRVEVPAGEAERAAEMLYLCGSLGGFETEGADGPVFVAVFSSLEPARSAGHWLRSMGVAAGPEESFEDEDWSASYRANLTPFTVAGFRIDARDVAGPPAGVDPNRFLHIPAAGAFGTGLHESTRGILRFLETDDLAGKRVLDVGCGTAILAIAAARLGAAECVGFDLDPEAVFEARKNLARNPTERAGGRVRLFWGGLECVAGKFDRVLANMIWEEVAPLVPSIARLLAPGGIAVLSGILDEREAAAVEGLRAAGLRVVRIENDGEWRVLVATASPGGRGSG